MFFIIFLDGLTKLYTVAEISLKKHKTHEGVVIYQYFKATRVFMLCMLKGRFLDTDISTSRARAQAGDDGNIPPLCVRACPHVGDAFRKLFRPHARTRDTCRLGPCFSASVEPCGYGGRFAASPSSRRSRVRPPHSPGRRCFTGF